MAERVYTVHCTWDGEAAVWVAASDDVPGLATGADTLDALVDKLNVVIPELLEANGLLPADDLGDIPLRFWRSGTSGRPLRRECRKRSQPKRIQTPSTQTPQKGADNPFPIISQSFALPFEPVSRAVS
jgi:predicted RNase H-like HicB family nuclease